MSIVTQNGSRKLYTTKTPITEADLLNERTYPFYGSHELHMLRYTKL